METSDAMREAKMLADIAWQNEKKALLASVEQQQVVNMLQGERTTLREINVKLTQKLAGEIGSSAVDDVAALRTAVQSLRRVIAP